MRAVECPYRQIAHIGPRPSASDAIFRDHARLGLSQGVTPGPPRSCRWGASDFLCKKVRPTGWRLPPGLPTSTTNRWSGIWKLVLSIGPAWSPRVERCACGSVTTTAFIASNPEQRVYSLTFDVRAESHEGKALLIEGGAWLGPGDERFLNSARGPRLGDFTRRWVD